MEWKIRKFGFANKTQQEKECRMLIDNTYFIYLFIEYESILNVIKWKKCLITIK